MMPKQHDIELPLLAALKNLGGKAKPQDAYESVTKAFPGLTSADLTEQLPSGGSKWTNRIQWVRQRLIDTGDMESPSYGVWAITSKGLARLGLDAGSSKSMSHPQVTFPGSSPPTSSAEPGAESPTNFEETVDDYLVAFKAKLLQKLLDLAPEKFEEFAGALLKGYGFQKVRITGKTGDGGIDGYGELKVGLAVVRAAFQCKRWQAQVGPKEVQAFRGAIQGQFEQGYFFATSTFSKAAQAESLKIGAAPVILFDGDQITHIMIERGIGVSRRPVELYDDQIENLFDGK